MPAINPAHMIELRHLRHVLALAEHHSFARAAEALHLSQPALTRSIQACEQELDVPLFERRRDGVVPTESGLLLLQRARMVVSQADDMVRETTAMKAKENGLRVAAGPYAARMVVAPTTAALLSARPGLRFHLEVANWMKVAGMLRERRVELAVCERSEVKASEMEVVALQRHTAWPMVRPGHPLTRLKKPGIHDVLGWPLAVTARLPPRVLRHLLPKERKKDFKPGVHCEDLGMVVEITAGSDAVSFLTLGMAEEAVRGGRLTPLRLELPWLHTDFALLRLRDRILTETGRLFVEEAQRVDEDLAARERRLAVEFGLADKSLECLR